jgi:quercetin dioxygenase-like cupin family protein
MQEPRTRQATRTQRRGGLLVLIALAVSAVGVLPSAADHELPHVQPLARGTFTDDVSASIKSKLDGRATHVRNLRDASDAMILQITLAPGAHAPWHAHTGPGILINTGPGTLTNIISDDCVPRTYGPGEAFVDPGQVSLHSARNDSDHEVVLYAVFLGVANGPVLPAPAPPLDCPPA